MTAQAALIPEETPQRAEYRPSLRLVEHPRHCGNRGRGRPRGSKNFLKLEVQRMIYDALVAAGGVEYLVRQAEENPKAFLALIAKLIPTQVGGAEEEPERMELPEIKCCIIDTDGTRYEYGRPMG